MTSIGRQVLNRWGLLAVALAAVLATVLAIQPVFGQASPPAAPTFPATPVVAVGLQTAELTWTAPPGTIVGYKIQRSTATPIKWVDVTANTGNGKTHYSDTHASLAGKSVQYRIAAINTLNSGPFSAPTAAVALPKAGEEPGAPTGLKAELSKITANAVTVSWNAATRGDSATSGYTVQWSATGEQPWFATDVTDLSTTVDTSATHSSVPPGATRYYRVAAINTEGTGPYTTAKVKATNRPSGVPEVPVWATTNPRVPVGLTTVELHWTPPATAPTVPITGYVIERSTDGGTTWVVAKADTGKAGPNLYYSDTHSSLAGKTNVKYRVAAINDLGTGVFIDASTLDGIRLPTRGREPGAPSGLTATATDTDTISVSWTAPTKADSNEENVTAFKIQWSAKGEQPWSDTTNQSSDIATTTITDDVAAAGQRRYYRVAATNSVGTGPYTTNKVGDTAGVPAAPTAAPTAEAVGLTTVELTWTAPTTTTVTGYKIERSTVSGATPKWVVAANNVAGITSGTSVYYSDTHSSLAGKTNVVYRVASIGTRGTSDPSAASTAIALPTVGNQPGAPTGLTATVSPTDFGMVRLSWTTPARGDTATSGYVVQHSKANKQPWMPLDPAHTGTDTTATDGTADAPVPPGTKRYYRVAAVNTGNTPTRGPFSAGISVTTPRAGLPAAPAAAPTANPVGLTRVELSWTASTDTTAKTYRIERSTDDGKTWAVAANNEAGVVAGTTVHYSDMHNGLAGRNVIYRVAAINSLGTGPFSDSSASVTLPKADKHPGAPTGLTVTVTSLTTATISWTAPTDKGDPDFDGYIIQYSYKGELPWMDAPASAGTDGVAVTHSGTEITATIAAANGVTQHYRVAAESGTAGTDQLIGPYSSPASAGAQLTVFGPASRSYAENGTVAVATYEVRGENAATARWTLEGADRGDFTLSRSSGESTMLRFRSPPNFEAPADADTNNVYMVTVKATVGSESDTQDVRVTVIDDQNEPTTLLGRYDNNPQNGKIDLDEVLDAIDDYFTPPIGSVINLDQVLDLIGLYFDGLRS